MAIGFSRCLTTSSTTWCRFRSCECLLHVHANYKDHLSQTLSEPHRTRNTELREKAYTGVSIELVHVSVNLSSLPFDGMEPDPA